MSKERLRSLLQLSNEVEDVRSMLHYLLMELLGYEYSGEGDKVGVLSFREFSEIELLAPEPCLVVSRHNGELREIELHTPTGYICARVDESNYNVVVKLLRLYGG